MKILETLKSSNVLLQASRDTDFLTTLTDSQSLLYYPKGFTTFLENLDLPIDSWTILHHTRDFWRL